jgi:ligand-binding SRPBCC domain-containing protein
VGSEIITSFRVLPFLPFRATWVARITEFEWNHHFADVPELGPFHSFHHRHELRPEIRDGVVGTAVMDVIELAAGFGWLGKVIEKLFVRRKLEQTFQHRQRALEELLAEDYAAGSTNTAVP